MMIRTVLLLALLLPTACASHHPKKDADDKNQKDDKSKETPEEKAARLKKEAAIAERQSADAPRFRKAVEVVRTIKVGDRDVDFYAKVNDARLYLEHSVSTPDGEIQRYAFADNSTAFVIVTIKDAKLAEIHTEGVAP